MVERKSSEKNSILESLPAMPIPETYASAEGISDIEVKLVDFSTLIDFIFQIKADGKQSILNDVFGNVVTVCTVGAFRSPILGKILHGLGMHSIGAHKLQDGMSITKLINFLGESTVNTEKKAVTKNGDKIDTIFMLSDLGDPEYGDKVKRVGEDLAGAVSRNADSTAMIPAQMLGSKKATETKVVIVNVSHTGMRYLQEQQDKLFSVLPKEIAEDVMKQVASNL